MGCGCCCCCCKSKVKFPPKNRNHRLLLLSFASSVLFSLSPSGRLSKLSRDLKFRLPALFSSGPRGWIDPVDPWKGGVGEGKSVPLQPFWMPVGWPPPFATAPPPHTHTDTDTRVTPCSDGRVNLFLPTQFPGSIRLLLSSRPKRCRVPCDKSALKVGEK